MKRFVLSPWVARAIEVALGGVFIYASLHKIADPPDFAKMVYNYRLVPNPLVNLFSILLPWLEVVAGTALIAGALKDSMDDLTRKGNAMGTAPRGVFSGGAAALVGAMLLLFVVAIGWNLLRGHVTDCGCFQGSTPKTRDQMVSEMWVVLGRDVLMLAGVVWIFVIRGAAGRKLPPGVPAREETHAPAV